MSPLFVPKDRKSLFRQFLAGMYDAVIITDPNGHIIEVNPRAEEYFGHPQESVIDRPISVYIPGLAPEIVQRIRKGLDENHHMMIDAYGLAKDGSKFMCEVTVSIIDLMDPGDLVFTVRNVQRRRKLLLMLRAKETAFELAHSALFSCDKTGAIMETNSAFRDMFDLKDEEDARRHTFLDFMDDAPLPENFQKALAGEMSVTGLVAEADGDDQEEVEIVLGPNRQGRKVIGVVGSIRKA